MPSCQETARSLKKCPKRFITASIFSFQPTQRYIVNRDSGKVTASTGPGDPMIARCPSEIAELLGLNRAISALPETYVTAPL